MLADDHHRHIVAKPQYGKGKGKGKGKGNSVSYLRHAVD